MPVWEFWAFVEARQELEAQYLLDTLNIQSIASGNLKEDASRDILRSYNERAGFNKWKKLKTVEKNDGVAWTQQLSQYLGGAKSG